MLKKKTKTAKAKKNQPKNNTGLDEQSLMYLRAQHEWDERIGSAVSSAHSWKLAAFAAFFCGWMCCHGGRLHWGAE